MRYIRTFVVSVVVILLACFVGPAFAQESSPGTAKAALFGVQSAKTDADRLAALQKLHGFKPATAEDVHVLLDAVREKSASVQTLTKVLMNADDPQLIPAFMKALDDPDVDVQTASVRTLGKMKAQEAVPALIKKFKALPQEFSPSANVDRKELEKTAQLGRHVAAALGWIGDSSAVSVLIARPEFYFLEFGESPLALIGAPAVPALLAVAKDTKDPRREKMCSIISSIKDPAAVPSLKAVLKDSGADSLLKASALAALSKMSTPGIDSEAQALLSDQDERSRLTALYWLVKYDKAQYTPKLLEFLNDKSGHIRSRTAVFAGELSVTEAAPRLVELLNDKDANVQKNSLNALEKLGNVKAALTVLDDRRVHAALMWGGKKHEAVIADISLVREVREGRR